MAENKGTWLDQHNQLKLKQEDKRSSKGKLDIVLIADMKILIQAALESSTSRLQRNLTST